MCGLGFPLPIHNAQKSSQTTQVSATYHRDHDGPQICTSSAGGNAIGEPNKGGLACVKQARWAFWRVAWAKGLATQRHTSNESESTVPSQCSGTSSPLTKDILAGAPMNLEGSFPALTVDSEANGLFLSEPVHFHRTVTSEKGRSAESSSHHDNRRGHVETPRDEAICAALRSETSKRQSWSAARRSISGVASLTSTSSRASALLSSMNRFSPARELGETPKKQPSGARC